MPVCQRCSTNEHIKAVSFSKGGFSLRQGDESGVEHFLQRQQHAKLGVVPGEAALIVDGVGLAHGAVGGELNGAALHECARRHDDVGIIARHRRGHGVNVAVHRGGSLNALAEGDHALGRAKLDALDDVVARLFGGGDDREAELFIARRDKHSALDRAGNDVGRKEETLVQRGHEAEVCADLLPESGGGEAVGAAIHALLRAADVAADGGKTAAGILDETADDHIRAEVARLVRLDKFTVAVVDHDDNIGAQLLAEGNGFARSRFKVNAVF